MFAYGMTHKVIESDAIDVGQFRNLCAPVHIYSLKSTWL